MSDKMSVDKNDPPKDESEESMESSPDGEAPPAPPAQQSENQQPKRKGGRKPIYATSEERKQRNRQAQAAFRERRTEYIKQLEESIHTHEQNLASLQAAHRHAADECLMLRYKNSLLERILLEKGIDVQAELRAKTGSPNLGPTHVPQNLVQPPPIQRPILNRHHHSRRSNPGIVPKREPGVPVSPLPPPTHPHPSALSPRSRHTSSSHSASPTATTFRSQHGTSPAGSEQPVRTPTAPATAMKAPPQQPVASMHGLAGPRPMQVPGLQQGTNHGRGRVAGSAAAFYPTPSFQNHIEELEQEYDAADMMDEAGDTPDTPSGPGPYPGPTYAGEPQPMSLSSPAITTGPPPGSQQLAAQSPAQSVAHSQQPTYPSWMTQLLDPSYDFDPFGLSASMAFPTQFSFDTSNMR